MCVLCLLCVCCVCVCVCVCVLCVCGYGLVWPGLVWPDVSLATTWFGHDLVWPRPSLAKPTMARPTLVTGLSDFGDNLKLADFGPF